MRWRHLKPFFVKSALSQWQQQYSRIHTVNQKSHPFYFLNSCVKNRQILIVIGTHIPENMCNHVVVMFPTSPE